MTASVIAWRRCALAGLVLAATFLAVAAKAQVPAPSEAAEINACLCLQQALPTLSAEMNARMQALAGVSRQLADLDAQVRQQRSAININDPDAIARFKALLDRRDATDRQLPPAHAAANQAVARYNARVNEYNARCANRPFSVPLVAPPQVPLACPPLQ